MKQSITWSAPSAIRSRREALGLSQSELADSLGLTKSHLSLVESGKRGISEQQIATLSRVLGLPSELLALGTGRLPQDVQGALDADAAGVVATIRQRTEAHAIAYPTSPSKVLSPRGGALPVEPSNLPQRFDLQKSTTSYRAHSYHTKVPTDAIRPFIRAFTRPGDIVYDPFCGSGMTGVAALMEERNALLSDLSPAAVHIARNYTSSCEPAEFAAAFKSVEAMVASTMNWLYRPVGSDRTVEYTTWSDIFRCANCERSFSYWDAVHAAGGTAGDKLTCPHCRQQFRKADLTWVGEMPVQSHTSSGSNRIDTHDVLPQELDLIEGSNHAPIPYWVPEVSFGPEREMWRASHQAMGIDEVCGFFTKRNLHALAALRHTIVTVAQARVREALMFAFTAAVNRASKRYQWNAKRPTNVMTGTLYVSSLRYEWNVWSLFRRKAADVLRYYQTFPVTQSWVDVFQRSATDLTCVPSATVDFVFMDPPFGSNIFYADSSLLWDAWLGDLTDQQSEIVVNRSRGPAEGGKSLSGYGDLMTQSFAHVARVLKRGGRAVLAFSNSDDQVWRSVQQAVNDAGFDTDSVHILNKGQPSIKGVKGVNGTETVTTFDLLLCLKHRPVAHTVNVDLPMPDTEANRVILAAVRDCAEAPRTDAVYSAVIRAALAASHSVSGITMPWVASRCRELGLIERQGLWALAQEAEADQADFVSGYLADRSDLPESGNSAFAHSALGNVRVEGGRGSAFYLAHSYHTKVPPEAITPFLEHFTQPGDVVLDPFCGSGMTGVAAALAGRRAILNDLSPAAVHLAWNHTRACDPDALAEGFALVERKVAERFKDIYRTTDVGGREAKIHWTLWSTRHRCTKCSHSFLLWDVMDKRTGRLGRTIECPECHAELRRSALPALGSEPAWVALEDGNGRRAEKSPDAQDLQRAFAFGRENVTDWFPTTALGPDREMFIRCALQLQGVSSVADLYTDRNLTALALLWRAIGEVENERVRRALAFAFTNTAWHGTRMRRFNARGGQRPLTGTLYIPQLSSEANVLEVMRNKIQQLRRYYQSFEPKEPLAPAIIAGSATNLDGVAPNSVDYVFTDPPFGSNIFYADCNLVWESWLGRLTDPTNEAVVNRSLSETEGGKSLQKYASLMARSMAEIHRVLKPGGWATVVFHNTDAEVWQAIHDAALVAGFEFHEAASLDRQQQSHKGYKGRSGSEDVAHFDVVFNLQKPPRAETARRKASKQLDVRELVRSLARDPEIAIRGLQGVHAEVMRQLASAGTSSYVDYAEIRQMWEDSRASAFSK
ncbi:MAG: DNA methyltransferase [Cupriavidus necator]